MATINFEVDLRGQRVIIEAAVIPPDRSVGIMGYGLEDETITDLEGNSLDWELTDEEWETVLDAMPCQDE